MIAEAKCVLTEFVCSGSAWLGNLRACAGSPWAEILLVLASVVCGAIIGYERKSRHKPVGMRTLTLICMGSTIFTFCSFLMASGPGDSSRIASAVVTGIGFLGAGTIIRTQGTVIGMTTAATIWVVAAIGMLIGIGYAVPGITLSVVVVVLLELRDHSNPRDRTGERQDNMP